MRTTVRLRVFGFTIIAVLLSLTSRARAEAWLDAGDSALRHDLQFLVDSSVIDLPLTAWPIPSTDVAWALDSIGEGFQLSPGQLAAVRRIKRRLSIFTRDSTRLSGHLYGAGNPQVLRSFENTPREEGEIGASWSAASERFSGRLAVSLAADPDDDKSVRLDGTYGSARLGNWLFTAGALDRWWGPGWDGSLILSSNARAVPALAIDRESSQAFRTPWLSWIGPWRLSTFMGQLENEREDRDHPLLFGMRATFRPFGNVRIGSTRPLRGIEMALERTAQWCGEGLPCDGTRFWDMFVGEDSAEATTPEDDPSNQLAGWTLRWASPFERVPVALYRQRIGETLHLDGPGVRQSLTLWGAETWGATQSGFTWRAHVEYAATACGEPDSAPNFDCAYNHSLFNVEGYRYRGRPIGHSLDGDGRAYTYGLRLSTPRQWMGSLLFRRADLNRGGATPDPRNTVAQEPVDLENIEVMLNLPLARADLALGVGYDRSTVEATDERDSTVRGFLTYHYRF